ncbi:MAG TPA: hypothetical protein VJ783_00560 [Pirellulales bacterium]|nr:hypothetical protein [Pirellulales bacterium]
MRAARGDSKMVTDIDVVAHDYSINFHHRKIYAECKGGKNRSALDRLVWVRGVKEAIAAEFAHLVVDHCDPSTVLFARTLGIEILQGASIDALESALRIRKDFWPGRSNLHGYSEMECQIREVLKNKTRGDPFAEWLIRAAESWRESTALTFSYGRLNTLFGILLDSRDIVTSVTGAHQTDILAYALAGLLVRLSQYVLFAASDTLGMTRLDRSRYLAERFTSGNLDIEHSRRILRGALRMVQSQLAALKIDAPVSWNIEHMLSAPAYTEPFAEVVGRAIAEGERARGLPLCMELRLFGFSGSESDGSMLIERVRQGLDLTGLIIGFAKQSLNITDVLLREPVSRATSVFGVNGKGRTQSTSLNP